MLITLAVLASSPLMLNTSHCLQQFKWMQSMSKLEIAKLLLRGQPPSVTFKATISKSKTQDNSGNQSLIVALQELVLHAPYQCQF